MIPLLMNEIPAKAADSVAGPDVENIEQNTEFAEILAQLGSDGTLSNVIFGDIAIPDVGMPVQPVGDDLDVDLVDDAIAHDELAEIVPLQALTVAPARDAPDAILSAEKNPQNADIRRAELTPDETKAAANTSEGKAADWISPKPTTAQIAVESKFPSENSAKPVAVPQNTEQTVQKSQATSPDTIQFVDPKQKATSQNATGTDIIKLPKNGLPSAVMKPLSGAMEELPAEKIESGRVEISGHDFRPLKSADKVEIQTPKVPTLAPQPQVGLGQKLQMLAAVEDPSSKLVTGADPTGPIDGLGAGPERTVSTTQTPTATPPTASAETARHVANQLLMAVSSQPGRITEISLNPEELGRVRLSLAAAEGAITVNLLAERPETNDLLRRHIDILAQEFRALGYADISFSFGRDNRAEQDGANADESGDTPQVATEDLAAPNTLNQSNMLNSGLDLRL